MITVNFKDPSDSRYSGVHCLEYCAPRGQCMTVALSKMIVNFHVGVYEAGGLALPLHDLGLGSIMEIDVLVGKDPNHNNIVPFCYGIGLDASDFCNPLLTLCDVDGELADGILVNKDVWLAVYGTRR